MTAHDKTVPPQPPPCPWCGAKLFYQMGDSLQSWRFWCIRHHNPVMYIYEISAPTKAAAIAAMHALCEKMAGKEQNSV